MTTEQVQLWENLLQILGRMREQLHAIQQQADELGNSIKLLDPTLVAELDRIAQESE